MPGHPYPAVGPYSGAVPWCEPCERYLTPNTVTADGACPSCGTRVNSGPDRTVATAVPGPATSHPGAQGSQDPHEPPTPQDAQARQASQASQARQAPQTSQEELRVPWHFWVVLALAVAYLGWRAIQGVALLF